MKKKLSALLNNKWLAGTFLGIVFVVLNLYYFGTLLQVPFHPDEATYIYNSTDLNAYFTNIRSLFWQPYSDNLHQHYREMDAPLTPLLIGAGFDLFGQTTHLNDWDWSKTWTENIQNGALPDTQQLFLARLTVCLFFPFSLILIYKIGKKLKHRLFGFLLCLLYSSNALILIHTRRSMEESLLAFFICLAIWGILNADKKPWIVMLGVTLAFNAKQSAIALLPVAVLALCWNPDHPHTLKSIMLRCLSFAGTFFILTFLLNPFLWNNPISAAKAALEARESFTQNQIQTIATLAPEQVYSPGERVLAMLAQYYLLPPAAQDVGNYSSELSPAIQTYLKLPGTTLLRGIAWGSLLIILTLLGLVTQISGFFHQGLNHCRYQVLLLLAFFFQCIILVYMIPIPYQRYWIPLVLLISLYILHGLYAVFQFISLALQRYNLVAAGK